MAALRGGRPGAEALPQPPQGGAGRAPRARRRREPGRQQQPARPPGSALTQRAPPPPAHPHLPASGSAASLKQHPPLLALGAPPTEGYWTARPPASPPRAAIGWLLRRSGRALRGAGVQVPAGRRLLSVAPTAQAARGELRGVSLPLRPSALGLP